MPKSIDLSRRTHGIAATYSAGCRCSQCREAKTESMRRYAAQRKEHEGAHPTTLARRRNSKTITCEWCGEQGQVQRRSSARFCSRDCARAAVLHEHRPRMSTELVHAPHLRDTRDRHVIGTRWTAGNCAHCGECFVGALGSRYCSDRCGVNASWARRYQRRGEFSISPLVRRAIYERDGWICQLCFDPVDPAVPTQDRMGATLDHIECQSWSLIPDHSPSNLRLAHRICNSIRGNESRVSA